MLRWDKYSTLKNYGDQISNKTWFYLNHTHILNIEEYVGSRNITILDEAIRNFNIQWMEHTIKYLRHCNFSAIVLYRQNALKAHINLTALRARAFLERDVIAERLVGYRFYGQFPKNTLTRAQVFFETGITGFWHKYIDFIIVLHTSSLLATEHHEDQDFNQNNGIAAKVFVFISSVALLVCIAVFIYESKLVCYTKFIQLILLCKNRILGRSKTKSLKLKKTQSILSRVSKCFIRNCRL